MAPLLPNFWRYSGYNRVSDFLDYYDSLGSDPVSGLIRSVVFSDFFVSRQCPQPKLFPCALWKKGCFKSFENLKKVWEESMIRGLEETKSWKIDYCEPVNEPEILFENLTEEQGFELHDLTYDLIRKYRPECKIVGSAFVSFSEPKIESYLKHLQETKRSLSALSWHEFASKPENIPEATKKARNLMALYGHCEGGCPEIHINEFLEEKHYYLPGWYLGYLSYLHEASIDRAIRACWTIDGLDSCWDDSFDGMYNKRGEPLHPYWVHQMYLESGGGLRLSSTSVASPLSQRATVLATRHDEEHKLRILFTRYGEGSPRDYLIKINTFPFGRAQDPLFVTLRKVPGNRKNEVRALKSPTYLGTESLMMGANREILIPLQEVKSGEVFEIVVVANESE